MKILPEDYDHNLIIDFEATLNGTVFGNVTIKNSVIVVINGLIYGDITIEKKSRAILYGTLNGAVYNHGICEIYGTINGELFDYNLSIFIDKNALINKKE